MDYARAILAIIRRAVLADHEPELGDDWRYGPDPICSEAIALVGRYVALKRRALDRHWGRAPGDEIRGQLAAWPWPARVTAADLFEFYVAMRDRSDDRRRRDALRLLERAVAPTPLC